MEDNRVPYIVYEGAQAKNERTVRRLVIALIVSVGLIFASNMAWLYVWSGYDTLNTDITTTQMYKQDGEGVNIIGDSNEVGDGANTNKDNNKANTVAGK